MDGRNKKFILELQKKPKLRRESGLYTVDGPKMAGELNIQDVENIYITKSFLASEHYKDCENLLRNHAYEIVQESEMKQMSDTVSPQGILVTVRQKKLKGIRELLSSPKTPLLLMLETIQDPGNLGTMIRMAEAAGVTGILMNRETVDAYSPKVVRSTMGALLRVPFVAVDDLVSAAARLSEGEYSEGKKISIFAASLGGAVDYASLDYRVPSAIMIGNESRGLSAELTEKADQKILIPMCGKTESLNAAVAASVICFEAARQRRL